MPITAIYEKFEAKGGVVKIDRLPTLVCPNHHDVPVQIRRGVDTLSLDNRCGCNLTVELGLTDEDLAPDPDPSQTTQDGFRTTASPGVEAVRNGNGMRQPDWTAKRLTDLQVPSIDIPWVWEGFLALGCLTLLTGLWKAGKTTLITWLVKNLAADGSFVGRQIRPTRILIVSEEEERFWIIRRETFPLHHCDHVRILSRPFFTRPSSVEWEKFISVLVSIVEEEHIQLVVFDSLQNLWPVVDENDATKVISALMPVRRLTAAQAAVLLVAHPRKGDGTEGQATRGSGAIPGFVDVLVEFRRHHGTQRLLTVFSRLSQEEDLVLGYDKTAGYTLVGTKDEASRLERLAVMLSLLPDEAPGLTPDEVHERWPREGSVPRPGNRTIRRDLEDAGQVAQTGQGTKGDPYRYWRQG